MLKFEDFIKGLVHSGNAERAVVGNKYLYSDSVDDLYKNACDGRFGAETLQSITAGNDFPFEVKGGDCYKYIYVPYEDAALPVFDKSKIIWGGNIENAVKGNLYLYGDSVRDLEEALRERREPSALLGVDKTAGEYPFKLGYESFESFSMLYPYMPDIRPGDVVYFGGSRDDAERVGGTQEIDRVYLMKERDIKYCAGGWFAFAQTLSGLADGRYHVDTLSEKHGSAEYPFVSGNGSGWKYAADLRYTEGLCGNKDK